MKKLAGFLLIMFFLGFGAASANAATLNGWAWTETFGWISFNSGDAGAGGGPYAVSINSSGDFSGYAWSEYLGWVSFNASDVPASCSASPQARLNTSTGAVTGWAYAMVYGSSSNGCIELSGANHASPDASGNGGVTYIPSTGKFAGYAWGGDTVTKAGPGWIQFNPTVSSPADSVVCFSTDCGYAGTSGITGTCNAITPYQNIQPNTSVTFEATATSGHSPYHYQWNGEAGWDTQNPNQQFTASYSSSQTGPTVVIKDKDNLLSPSISCPSVTVLVPLTSSNLLIGRTVGTANAASLTVKQFNPFALLWSFTLSKDYSCTPTVSPDPNDTNWNSNWKNGNLGMTNNNDNTRTWAGNTGTNLTAGASEHVINPGIYQFRISCTSNDNEPQSVNVVLKINYSNESEI